MMSPSISRDSEKADATGKILQDSRQQPAWHVIVLGMFGCLIVYLPYWAFKNWRDLKRESIEVNGAQLDEKAAAAGVKQPTLAPVPPRKENLHLDQHTRDTLLTFSRISPGLRGLGMFVPMLNIYLMTTLTIGVANLVPRETSFPRKNSLLAALCIVGAWLAFMPLWRLPDAWYMLSFLAVVPIAFLQHWLNEYWASVESDELFVRHGFNLWEMLLIIVGASLLGLDVAGIMMGIKI